MLLDLHCHRPSPNKKLSFLFQISKYLKRHKVSKEETKNCCLWDLYNLVRPHIAFICHYCSEGCHLPICKYTCCFFTTQYEWNESKMGWSFSSFWVEIQTKNETTYSVNVCHNFTFLRWISCVLKYIIYIPIMNLIWVFVVPYGKSISPKDARKQPTIHQL